ncbi:hypothetical protein [Paraclostridium sordellii]|nr:hypothetical protein [Paeniclostridium sordellii]EPZ56137.1 hypothetical protein H476_2739 [[Clostridium] sordellii VPI 9048] [Paeniclostridium sordellii VPI 9048]
MNELIYKYSILVTRSRKGMILYIPNDENLYEIYDFFKSVGINN